MRVLGIESSGTVAGLAVADESGLLAELAFRHRQQLSRFLAPRVEEVLALAGLDVADLQGVAVSLGPGSFTGLRIGVTAAKSLAYARGLPVAGVGTLEAIASEHPAPARALVCAVVPASATDVFAALFQWNGGRLEPRAEELMLSAADLAARPAKSPLDVVVAGNAAPFRETLREVLGPRLTLTGDDGPRAATIALLGRRRLLDGREDPVHALAPRYLRPSAAEARRKEGLCPPR